MNDKADMVTVDEESAEFDLRDEAEVVCDAVNYQMLDDDIHSLAHLLIAAYAGLLEIGGQCWSLISSTDDEEHCLVVPVPEDVGHECDNVYLFVVLQWYKRRLLMQQILAVADNEVVNLLAADESRAAWLLKSLIDYYKDNPANNAPRFGDECPICNSEGEALTNVGNRESQWVKKKCVPCLGKGRLPTLGEYYDLLIAFQAGPVARRQHGRKVGRNDPCPCKSGKKYKHCHG